MSEVHAVPYMMFQGNAREAMSFYAEILGGKVDFLEIGTAMPDAPNPKAIMHSDLVTDFGIQLMGADEMQNSSNPAGAGAVTITLIADDSRTDWAQSVFDALADGGTVNVPLMKQMWGDTYGNVEDRFGIRWAINLHPKDSDAS